MGYGPLAESNVAFACYAAVFLLSRLYLPVLLVFAGADAVLARTFLTDTVLGEKGLPLVLAVVSLLAERRFLHASEVKILAFLTVQQFFRRCHVALIFITCIIPIVQMVC